MNRVINQPESVRKPTRDRVLHAAEDIGFFGLGSIESAVTKARETHRLGVLLQQGYRAFYEALGQAFRRAAETFHGANIELDVGYLSDLAPENVAARLRALRARSESVSLVAAEHPRASEAITHVPSSGVPVTGMIGPLSAQGHVGFVGLDNWKVGRTAAWAFHKMCREPGEIGILVGNHRYRNQELNESGFRSYFREHGNGFQLLEPPNRPKAKDLKWRSQSMAWIDACARDDIEEEDLIRFDHDGRTFVIYRSPDDDFFCTDGLCTHEHVHLEDGLVMEYEIECPKHNATFDYRTGEALRAPACVNLNTYPVKLDGDRVMIDL